MYTSSETLVCDMITGYFIQRSLPVAVRGQDCLPEFFSLASSSLFTKCLVLES